MNENEFEIELPSDIVAGDYVQSTPSYERMFNKSLYGRCYNVVGEICQIYTRDKDKISINKDWINKVYILKE